MRTIIGVVGTEDVLETLDAGGLPGVAETMRITAPYKLVSAQNHAKRTTIRVGGVPIGPDTFTLIAGPCAVETPEQTLESARMAKRRRRHAAARRCVQAAHLARTRSRVSASRGCEILAEVRDEVRPARRHRGDGRRRRRRRRRARRHAADRHPQHAELRAAAGRRRGRQAGDAQARADRDLRGMADGRRVHRAARQPRHRAVRARRPLLRAGDPQHARRVGRADGAAAVAPAGDRRPVARRRAAATSSCRSPAPASPPAPTASWSTSTRTRRPRCATARRRCSASQPGRAGPGGRPRSRRCSAGPPPPTSPARPVRSAGY